MKRKRTIKKSKTLADIMRIPKWARMKLFFTCEEVEFSDELVTHFFGKDLDTVQTRQASLIPEIDLNAVTSWVED